MSEQVFIKIKTLLTEQNAKFKVLEHESMGTSEEVAKARGTHIGQGAKALVCTIKGVDESIWALLIRDKFIDEIPAKNRLNVLAVLPADHQANLELLTAHFKAKRASLASPPEVAELTDCVFGSIPPFSFHNKLLLVVDPKLFVRYDEIAFNAGLLDRSIVLNTNDYKRIVSPMLVEFATI